MGFAEELGFGVTVNGERHHSSAGYITFESFSFLRESPVETV